VLGGTDVDRLLSANLIASLGSVAVAATIAVLLARLVWKREAGDTVIAAFCSAYVNAGNLGLPIAAYALGDAALIAPMLLAQLLLLQPAGLAVLDEITHVPSDEVSWRRLLLTRLTRPFRNPLAVGSLIGLVLALTGITLPVAINAPLTLVGGIAVPSMLLAYGISLRLGPRPGAGEPPIQIATLVWLKLVLQPIAAYLIGAYLVGLAGHDLLAVTVIAALPTAQNVFTIAMRYDRGVIMSRDTIFVATPLSVPVILIITWLLA
jgi:malonate transporter